MLDIARKLGVRAVKREHYYASSKCNNSEFFEHIAKVTECDYILYSPVTSPLVSKETYMSCISKFVNSNIENLVTVSEIKHHMWLDGEPLNYDPSDAPNSQDLPDIYSVNYGCCIISCEDLHEFRNVVTDTPTFHVTDEIESILCFLENYGCHEVDFGVKMTARPFSTIHLLMDQFIERGFTILFLLL